MIFATVGTQLPFPRLVGELDRLAGEHRLEIVAQTCDPEFRATNMTTHAHLEPKLFESLFSAAKVVVGHAGIGTILCAKKYGKPIILMPRRASFGEHRNEHQLATVAQLGNSAGIHVALETDALERLLLHRELAVASDQTSGMQQALIDRISEFIDEN